MSTCGLLLTHTTEIQTAAVDRNFWIVCTDQAAMTGTQLGEYWVMRSRDIFEL